MRSIVDERAATSKLLQCGAAYARVLAFVTILFRAGFPRVRRFGFRMLKAPEMLATMEHRSAKPAILFCSVSAKNNLL